MSTRTRRPRCAVCRNVLPENAQGGKCSSCLGQTVLFPKRAAERLSRPSSDEKDGA
jgi:hypothetical protein